MPDPTPSVELPPELTAIVAEIDAQRRYEWRDYDFTGKEYKAPGSPEWDWTCRELAKTEWERRRNVDVYEQQVAAGMHLPAPEGTTPADWGQIELRIEETSEGPRTSYRFPDGQRFDVDSQLEQKVALWSAVVSGQHATDHTAVRVPWCAPCEARARGEERHAEADQRAADGRLRRLLKLHNRLPAVRAPQPEAPLLTLSELRTLQPAGYLVSGVIPHQAVGILRARDGMGKTFAALDLALHIAAGLIEWHGRDVDWVNDGRALYLWGEGASAAPKRTGAWCEAHPEADQEELDRNLMVYPGSVNLFTGSGFDRILCVAEESRPDLIVIDTLQTNTAGADHNSASDMAVAGERLRALQRASGGTVLVLAHTGKSDRDTRGSSAIEDDADFVLHVAEWSAPGSMRLDITKMKDGSTGSLTLGVRRAADSLVLTDPGEAPQVEWSSSSPASRVLGALRQLLPTGPATAPQIQAVLDDDGRGLPPMNRGTTYKTLAKLVRTGEVRQVIKGATKRYELPEADQ